MGRAIQVWRVLMWTLGGLFILPSAFLLWTAFADPDLQHYRLSIVLNGLYFLASALGPVGAFGMKRGKRWGRRAGWIAASIQTLAIPLFTPFGLFGLVLLFCGAGKTGTGSANAAPSKRLAIIAGYVVLVPAIWLPLHEFFLWAKHLGYPRPPSSVIGTAILGICVVLQIVIHEGGHALAVKLLRGYIHRFQIGPLWWRRESGRTWIEFRRKLPHAGSVAWTPGLAHRLARQDLWVALGGPIANLVCGLAALAAFPWLGEIGVPHAWTWAMFIAITNFGSLANLWPMRKGHQNSDGGAIRDLLTSTDFRRLKEIALFESMSDSSGLRPSEWPRRDVEWTLALENIAPFASHHTVILQAGCAHYLDSGNAAEAVGCARRFHELAREQPERCSPSSFAEATFTLAFYGGDPESARDLWACRPSGLPVQFELADCLALAVLANDEDRPAAIWRGWECSGLYGSCGTLEYLREQLRRLEMGSLASIAIVNPALQAEPVGVLMAE